MLVAIALTVALHLLIIYVPFGNRLFSTQRLTLAELGITLAVSSLVFWVVELQKLILRWRAVPTVAPLPALVAPPLPEAAALAAA